MSFYSKDNDTESNRGSFGLRADDGTNNYTLFGRAKDGALFWGSKRVITQYTDSNLYFDHTSGTSKDVGYSTANNNTNRGAYLTFWNGDDASNAGTFRLAARDANTQV